MKSFHVYTQVHDQTGEIWSNTQEFTLGTNERIEEARPQGFESRLCKKGRVSEIHEVLRSTLRGYEEDRNLTGQAGIHWVMESLDWREVGRMHEFSAPPLAWEIMDNELGGRLDTIKWEVQE